MMVVADSGPLHYLLLIGEIHILPKLYKELRIPVAVAEELSATRTPPIVAEWMAHLPEWARVDRTPLEQKRAIRAALDAGEAEAITLACTIGANLVLLDDLVARRYAKQLNLRVTGTLGILLAGAELGDIDVPQVIRRLRATNFFFDEVFVNSIFEKWL